MEVFDQLVYANGAVTPYQIKLPPDCDGQPWSEVLTVLLDKYGQQMLPIAVLRAAHAADRSKCSFVVTNPEQTMSMRSGDMIIVLAEQAFVTWYTEFEQGDNGNLSKPKKGNANDLYGMTHDQTKGNLTPDSDSESPLLKPRDAKRPWAKPELNSKQDVDALIAKYFDRYDVDESGTINNDEEMMNLTTNLVCTLNISMNNVAIQALVDGADVTGKNAMSLSKYTTWFKHSVLHGKSVVTRAQLSK